MKLNNCFFIGLFLIYFKCVSIGYSQELSIGYSQEYDDGVSSRLRSRVHVQNVITNTLDWIEGNAFLIYGVESLSLEENYRIQLSEMLLSNRYRDIELKFELSRYYTVGELYYDTRDMTTEYLTFFKAFERSDIALERVKIGSITQGDLSGYLSYAQQLREKSNYQLNELDLTSQHWNNFLFFINKKCGIRPCKSNCCKRCKPCPD